MDFDPSKVRANAERSETDDLLDRVTVYRAGMEPEAVELIEKVLLEADITAEAIRSHVAEQALTVPGAVEGRAEMCSFCRLPAVARGWYWHRLFGKLPLFPLTGRFCRQHVSRRWGPSAEPEAGPHPQP